MRGTFFLASIGPGLSPIRRRYDGAMEHPGELFYLVVVLVAFLGFAGSLFAVSELEDMHRRHRDHPR